MAAHEDDIVMESTSDTPEQIAEGLGIELSDADGDTPEGAEAAVEAAEASAEGAEPEVPGEASADAAIATAARGKDGKFTSTKAKKRAPKAKTDPVEPPASDDAAARLEALETENADLKRRIETAASPGAGTPAAPVTGVAPRVDPVTPDQIPATHPELVELTARRTALGAEPEQDKFEEFTDYQKALRVYDRKLAALDAEESVVRRHAATRATQMRQDAATAAATMDANFQNRKVAAKAKIKDYDAVMARASELGINITPVMKQFVLEESAIGPELVHALAKEDGKEALRIGKLSPMKQVAELTLLEAQLSKPAPKPAARITKAPEPGKTQLGNAPGTATPVDLSDPNLPYAEYKRLREAQNLAEGRRIH